MSLRARLLVGLVVLVAIGLGVTAIVTYEEQRAFLYTRVDQQVAASELPVSAGLGLVSPRILSPTPPVAGRGSKLAGRGASTFQESGTYGELLNTAGQVIKVRSFTPYGSTAASPPALPRRLRVSRLGPQRLDPFTVDSRAGSGLRYRVVAFSVGAGRTLVIAIPMREVDQTLHRLMVVEGLVGGGVILALLVLGWIVIMFSLRPLQRIGRVASDIAHGDLSRRVTQASQRTEIGRLGLALNEMLVQIERAFADRQESEDRLRQFLADASHELRTPLASIRGYAELFRLGAAGHPGALERAMARIESEAMRMGVLVEDLLMLASLDELPEIRRGPVDLWVLARQAADDIRAIAPARQVRLSAETSVIAQADPDQLRQVFANLTRNAVIHTPAESPIDLTVSREQDPAVLEVRDYGPGLPENAVDHVFDRFWRTEGGRTRGRGGAGLGLAIVKAIVVAHHGTVDACNAPGGGARFRVTLPLMDAVDPARGVKSDIDRLGPVPVSAAPPSL